MCPGKRSFWTSLAVSPFQGQSRGQRLLWLFDFGKTSPLLSANFTHSPLRGLLGKLKVCATGGIASKNFQKNSPGADSGGTKLPHRGETPKRLRQTPNQTLTLLLMWDWSKSTRRKKKVKVVHRVFSHSWLFTFPNTAPCEATVTWWHPMWRSGARTQPSPCPAAYPETPTGQGGRDLLMQYHRCLLQPAFSFSGEGWSIEPDVRTNHDTYYYYFNSCNINYFQLVEVVVTD